MVLIMSFTKMMLVPDPGAVAKTNVLRNEMTNVFRERDSDDEKVKKLRGLMMDYLHYYNSARSTQSQQMGQMGNNTMLNNTSVTPHVNNKWWGDSYSVPSRGLGTPVGSSTPYQVNNGAPSEGQIANLITAITKKPEILTYTPKGEMVYHGVTVPDTDIIDLMSGQGGQASEIFNAGVQEVMEPSATLPDVTANKTQASNNVSLPDVTGVVQSSGKNNKMSAIVEKMRQKLKHHKSLKMKRLQGKARKLVAKARKVQPQRKGIKRKASEEPPESRPSKYRVVEDEGMTRLKDLMVKMRKRRETTRAIQTKKRVMRGKRTEAKRRRKVVKTVMTNIKRSLRKRKRPGQMIGPMARKYKRLNEDNNLQQMIEKARGQQVASAKKRTQIQKRRKTVADKKRRSAVVKRLLRGTN